MTDKTKAALLLLGGAALGVGIGLLFAPRPGKETRQRVKQWLDEKAEDGKKWLAKGKEELDQKKEQLSAAYLAGKKAYYAETAKNGHRREPVTT